jgi:hypothetical protein
MLEDIKKWFLSEGGNIDVINEYENKIRLWPFIYEV